MPVPFDPYAELLALARALDAAGLEYALCGGLALAVYGAPRATRDIDLFDQRVRLGVEGGSLQVVTRDGLIVLKTTAGRPQDLVDIQRLMELERD